MKRQKDMHPEDIKAAIRKIHGSLKQLAILHGYSARSISVALQKPWPDVEAIIASAIGKTAFSIWPSRYLPDGTPKSVRSPNRDNSRQSNTINMQFKDAA